MLEKTTRMNFLYDFYELLLTEKQQQYMALYYRDDYTLTEIAELTKVSRQAVYDNIKRTEQTLETYEKVLKLYNKFTRRHDIIKQLKEELTDDKAIELVEQLENLN